MTNAQQRENVEVLAGLRHDSIVGGYHQIHVMPVAPATMVFTKCSCLGRRQSPLQIAEVAGRSRVGDIPRSFSSLSRSVSHR